jgi:NhaC family Na+:H+ antiporter
MPDKEREIGIVGALFPIAFLIGVLFLTIVFFEQDVHVPLVLAAAVASCVAACHGYPWSKILEGMTHGINLAMGAVLVLMVVGMMIGTWMLGGVVPTMIFYGLKLLSPEVFLVATLLICSVVSLGTGSSWSTAGTVGVALMAAGDGMSIPAPMVAGAIISGAYFGDKMSPLSDTTNLAPAVAGTDVFTHIRHMLYTTGPSYLISMVLFAVFGFGFSADTVDSQKIVLMLETLETNFWIHPVLLLAPVFVISMVIMKVPPLPALLGGVILGGIFAVAFQSNSVADVFLVAQNGYQGLTSSPETNKLLSQGGLINMMSTVAIIICALSFGGVMERTGMLSVIANSLLKFAKSSGSLVATTILSCIAMNIVSADQYMAVVVNGRMYKKAYEKIGLHPKNLSRALEDSATLTSPLVPWNSCGAYMHATLKVDPLFYLPYAFLNLINPLISLFYGFTGITMEKQDPEKSAEKS